MTQELAGRFCLVSGASGNVGAAVCRRLVAGGVNVIALTRTAADGEKLGAALGAGDRLFALSADLADERSCEAAFDSAEARGPLWAAVNTVGSWAGGKTVAQTELATLDAMLAVNVRTAFLFTRAALRRFEKRRAGRLVHVAAFSAFAGTGLAGAGAYNASKAALLALTKAAAEEAAPMGVRASCVAPATLRTPQNAAAMPGAAQNRWVALEEVAEAIAFLCAPANSGTNGAVLPLPEK